MKPQDEIQEITINGVNYVRADNPGLKAANRDGQQYVIIRTYSAGVFAGYLKSRDGKEVVLNDARRLWYWKGAASLSQLAVDGVSCPDECKFPCELPEITLTEVIEVIQCTEKAMDSIAGVKIWKA